MIVFAAGVASAMMMLAGVALMIYIVMRKAHLEQMAQRRSRVVSDVPSLPRSKPTRQTSDSGVEMAEMARDLNGQLTTKMIVLEQLIADSQKQIERMEELLERIDPAKRES
jgi:hypothetical protein